MRGSTVAQPDPSNSTSQAVDESSVLQVLGIDTVTCALNSLEIFRFPNNLFSAQKYGMRLSLGAHDPTLLGLNFLWSGRVEFSHVRGGWCSYCTLGADWLTSRVESAEGSSGGVPRNCVGWGADVWSAVH